MRRNRTFRVGDVMAVLDLTLGFCKQTLWYFEQAKYLKLESNIGKYRDRVYTLIKNTGAKNPSIVNGIVYDYNNKESINIGKKTDAIRETIKEIFKDKEIKHEDILGLTKLPKSTVVAHLKRLMKEGYIEKVGVGIYKRCRQSEENNES